MFIKCIYKCIYNMLVRVFKFICSTLVNISGDRKKAHRKKAHRKKAHMYISA